METVQPPVLPLFDASSAGSACRKLCLSVCLYVCLPPPLSLSLSLSRARARVRALFLSFFRSIFLFFPSFFSLSFYLPLNLVPFTHRFITSSPLILARVCAPFHDHLGTRFTLFPGACRTASDTQGTFIRHANTDGTQCRTRCEKDASCQAYEIADDTTCEIHTAQITNSTGDTSPNISCFIRTPSMPCVMSAPPPPPNTFALFCRTLVVNHFTLETCF